MASLEKQKGWWRIIVRYGGQKHQRSLDTQDDQEAQTMRVRVEENLRLFKKGRLEYQPGDDLITLLLSDGKLNAQPVVAKRVSLGDFFKRYRENRPPGKEANTVYTEDIHIEHLLRLIGSKTGLSDVPRKLQEYVNRRSSEKGRRDKPVSHVTVKKELGTLTSIWNKYGMREKLVHGQRLAHRKGHSFRRRRVVRGVRIQSVLHARRLSARPDKRRRACGRLPRQGGTRAAAKVARSGREGT